MLKSKDALYGALRTFHTYKKIFALSFFQKPVPAFKRDLTKITFQSLCEENHVT
jgi:hypothetical protein